MEFQFPQMCSVDLHMAQLSISAVFSQLLSPFLQVSICRRGECSNFLRRNFSELMDTADGSVLVGFDDFHKQTIPNVIFFPPRIVP